MHKNMGGRGRGVMPNNTSRGRWCHMMENMVGWDRWWWPVKQATFLLFCISWFAFILMLFRKEEFYAMEKVSVRYLPPLGDKSWTQKIPSLSWPLFNSPQSQMVSITHSIMHQNKNFFLFTSRAHYFLFRLMFFLWGLIGNKFMAKE